MVNGLVKLSIIGITLSLLFLSTSLVKTFPLLKINHLEVYAKNREAAEAVRRIVAEEFHNNILELYLNRALFLQMVERETKYYVKGVEFESFSPFGGTLRLKLEEREPVAVLNGRFLISRGGILFGLLPPKGLPEIRDNSGGWKFGYRYGGLDVKLLPLLAERYGINRVEVRGELLTLKGRNRVIVLRRDWLNADPESLDLPFGNSDTGNERFELFGNKAVYVKIFKESTNE